MNEEEIINILTDDIVALNVGYEKYEEAVQGLLDLYNKEKEKNKELTDKLKDRINQIIDELIKLYFEEDSYCFSGFMFNNKTFNSLNIKEEMTVMQLLKHLQRLLKQEEE